MIVLGGALPAEIVPLSWLIGLWEGTGIVDYRVGDESRTLEFGQRLSFTHDGSPHLDYRSSTWLLGGPDAEAAAILEGDNPDSGDRADSAGEATPVPHITEVGYWRLSRPASPGDSGPGLLPGVGPQPFTSADSVETLRNANDAFDIEVSLVHPTGVSELYIGEVKGPRIELATDAVVRTASAKEYAAATRIYGLVEGHLLWAWDIAALGQDLRTHASGRLARVE